MIEDPLGRIYGAQPPLETTVKNPVTGVRENIDALKRQLNREEETKRKRAVTRRVVLMLMQDELGREWLFDKLTACNLFGTPFTQDPLLTAFNSGALHIGRGIETDIKQNAPREYQAMCMEGWDREEMWASDAADK